MKGDGRGDSIPWTRFDTDEMNEKKKKQNNRGSQGEYITPRTNNYQGNNNTTYLKPVFFLLFSYTHVTHTHTHT